MTKLTQRYPPTPRPYASGQNLEIGLAELIQQSAGLGATLEGHTNGSGLVVGVANPAPRNPSGDFGHDHSGGEFGRPLFRTVATVTFDDGATFNATPILGGTKARPFVPDGADGTTNRGAQVSRWIWVPPCDPVNGAYVSLGVAVALYASGSNHADVSSGPISGDVVTLRVWRRNEGSQGQVVAEFTIGTPTVTGQKFVESSDASTRLTMKPGALNEVVFELEMARTTGGSTRGFDAWLLEAEFGVYES